MKTSASRVSSRSVPGRDAAARGRPPSPQRQPRPSTGPNSTTGQARPQRPKGQANHASNQQQRNHRPTQSQGQRQHSSRNGNLGGARGQSGRSSSIPRPHQPPRSSSRNANGHMQKHPSQRQPHLNSGKRQYDFEANKFHQEEMSLPPSHAATHNNKHDVRFHMPLYSRPQQMQRWGEEASHPHVDWGGLFYDLFYVAAAYNIGSVYISAIDDVSVQEERPLFLYVIAAFGAIWMTWYNTVAYEARYSVLDYIHRVLHVLRILAISFSIVHIKSFDHFSDPLDPTMFNFLFGLLLESLINLAMWVEIWCVGQGGPELKQEAKFTVLMFILPQVILYMVASSIAGTNCFNSSSSDDAGEGEGAHRLLGEAKETDASPSFADDRPIWIVFAAYVLYQLTAVFWSLYVGWVEIREKYCTPINVDFCIHRLGEWVMLMLGESVLSLLIVGLSEERDYYIIVVIGVLTVVMIQDLHFESQPSDADDHAMKKMRAGSAYVLLIQGYSLALIFLGASYKYMLDLLNHKGAYGDDKEKDGEGSYESDGGESSYPNEEESYEGSYRGSRLLGGSIVNPEDAQKSKEYVVWMYCLSVVFILLALELMLMSHQGFPWKRWFSSSNHVAKEPWKRGLQAFMFIVKIALLVFFAVYATNSTLISLPVADITFFGGAIVFVFLCMRIVDWEFIQSDDSNHAKGEKDSGRAAGVDPHHASPSKLVVAKGA